jgi:hypothetical protein
LIQEVDAYLAWADKHADMVTQPRHVTLQRRARRRVSLPEIVESNRHRTGRRATDALPKLGELLLPELTTDAQHHAP